MKKRVFTIILAGMLALTPTAVWAGSSENQPGTYAAAAAEESTDAITAADQTAAGATGTQSATDSTAAESTGTQSTADTSDAQAAGAQVRQIRLRQVRLRQIRPFQRLQELSLRQIQPVRTQQLQRPRRNRQRMEVSRQIHSQRLWLHQLKRIPPLPDRMPVP